jgi:hypothetical protein
VVLSETSKSRIQFVPFFIPRSHGTDLSIKIQTYRKAAPPADWSMLEEKSVSLDEAASRKLLSALRMHLAVAEEGADGDYIVIKVAEGTAHFGEIEPEAVATAITRVLSRPDIAKHLASTELSDELIGAFKGAIRLKEMRSAVAKLRQHLDGSETAESVYQAWCKEHSWAFGNAYVMTDAVRDISAGDSIDLLMPTVISGYRDIVELKRPDVDVLNYDVSHRNYYFASDVSKAIGQIHRYMDVLHEVAANGLRDHPEIVAYHPRAIIVAGRSIGWQPDRLKALHGLNSRLNGIMIMTYDQLLAQGERLVDILSSEQGSLFDEPAAELPVFDDEEGDLPF